MKVGMNQREKSFDIAKGIGMLAVVLGHMSIPAKWEILFLVSICRYSF